MEELVAAVAAAVVAAWVVVWAAAWVAPRAVVWAAAWLVVWVAVWAEAWEAALVAPWELSQGGRLLHLSSALGKLGPSPHNMRPFSLDSNWSPMLRNPVHNRTHRQAGRANKSEEAAIAEEECSRRSGR